MTIAHIFNGELGFDVRTKLNEVIDIVNTPPSGGMSIGGAITGGTAGRVLFAGAGGILDDDSTFTWNDTLKDLAIGGAYYVAAARALYVVPNVAENNWFEGSSGNLTVTGAGNFGTGDLALAALTSGAYNTAVGTRSMNAMQSGSYNFALGVQSLRYSTTNTYNVAIGYNALQMLGYSGAAGGNNNIAIGYSTMSPLYQGANNIAIGQTILSGISTTTTGSSNTIVGAGAGRDLGAGASGGTLQLNTMIGFNCGVNLRGLSSRNVWIGGYAGLAAVYDNTIGISNGNGQTMLDFSAVSQYVWSFNMSTNSVQALLHIYNKQSPAFTTTNYERGIIGWAQSGANANMFRIGTENAGTGMVDRIVCIKGFAKAGVPVEADISNGYFAVFDDTTNNRTWLVFDKAGTLRQTEIGGVTATVGGAANPVFTTTAAITSGAGANAGTLTNAPAAGDPTKWIPINDNGTTRYIPAW